MRRLMLFPRSAAQRPELTLTGDGLVLRPPLMSDFEQWAALRERSRAFLQPWEPRWADDELTRSAFRRRLDRYEREIEAGESLPLFIMREADEALMGGLNVTGIRRGAASAGQLGYWMGQPFAGKGVMTAAVRLAVRFAHGRLGLRRIEAACLPENAPSLCLLERTGFRREGLARQYLSIDGAWRDHLLYARLPDDPL